MMFKCRFSYTLCSKPKMRYYVSALVFESNESTRRRDASQNIQFDDARHSSFPFYGIRSNKHPPSSSLSFYFFDPTSGSESIILQIALKLSSSLSSRFPQYIFLSLNSPYPQSGNGKMFLQQAFLSGICLFLINAIQIAKGFSAVPTAPLTRSSTFVRTTTTHLGAKEELSAEEKEAKMTKAMKAMTSFTNKYLQNTDTKLCQDKAIAAVVVKGLAEHKVQLGTPLCPCRFYEDKEAEAKDGYWNCPCVPMRERHECHCMLFLTEDNAFAGEEQVSMYIHSLFDSSS
jgi:ferredoxin-thioredoxin reductase catalytic chain